MSMDYFSILEPLNHSTKLGDNLKCNYFQDNSRELESKKRDFIYMALIGIEGIPIITCKTGISDYEPTQEEQKIFCSSEFMSCPRFKTKLQKRN